jgi:predicted transcriptional regulator of viral defense system
MDWIGELESKYGANEPLTIDEVDGVLSHYSTPRIYQLIDIAIAAGRLMRFENGIYYIPTRTIFGVSRLDPAKVVFRKYVTDGKMVYGFYSGLTLLNGLGLTTQVPNVIEVVTNNEASRLREVYVDKQRVRLRCARVPVTSENADALTILDLFNQLDPDKVDDADWRGVIDFIKENRLTLKKILGFSNAYPAKAVKNLMNSGVAYEVA